MRSRKRTKSLRLKRPRSKKQRLKLSALAPAADWMGVPDHCLFCQIISRNISAKIVSESDDWLAFKDVHPQSPTHCLIIPKRHLTNLSEAGHSDEALIGAMLIELSRLAVELGIHDDGYRIVTNCNLNGGQTVGHLHFHLLGGRKLMWPPG